MFSQLLTHADSTVKIDSLKVTLKTANQEQKLDIYEELGNYYNNKLPDSSIVYFKAVIDNLTNDELRKAKVLHSIAIQFDVVDKFDSANYYYKKAFSIADLEKSSQLKAKILNSQGVTAYRQGLYETSISYYLEGLKFAEEISDTNMVVKMNDNIGHIFYYQNDFDKAEKHYKVALKYGSENSNSKFYAGGSMNLGYLYLAREFPLKAKESFLKALKIYKEQEDNYWMSNAYQNVAVACNRLKQYDEAEVYYLESLKIFRKTNQQEGIAQTYINLGEMFVEVNDFEKAKFYFDEGIRICEEIGIPEGVKYAFLGYKTMYEKTGDFDKALKYYEKFVNLRDSLVNQESKNQINELETKYESEKKQREIDILNRDKKLSELKIAKKNQLLWTSAIVIVLIIVLLAYLIYSIKEKKKINALLKLKNINIEEANEELNQQNEEILAQRDEIERQHKVVLTQNKEISESIKVAERIQRAFFTTEDKEKSLIPEHFVIFKPRDIVSGDFYWSHTVKNEKQNLFYISVVDCTGHGVPGALMSMLGLSSINEILAENNVIEPAELLEKLRTKIISEFNQNKDSLGKEGMDMSVVKIDLNKNKLSFAGANSQICIVNNGEVEEVKGTKSPIGYSEEQKNFENRVLDLKIGSMIYLYSDGYPDQFGGPRNKKIGYGKLRELFLLNSNYSLVEQNENLSRFLSDWMDGFEQIDDITLFGMRI